MNEKIILENPNGETEERNVICHFKSVSDDKPNIKNVSVLVIDKNEMNNGNKVLEFLWEKDGIYQAINDDVAWSEVKSVFVDMIKNNLDVNNPKVNFLVLPNVKVALGGGRPLAVNDVQVSTLVNNVNTFKAQLQNSQQLEQNSITETVTPEVNAETVTPETTPVINEVPVMDTPVETPVAETPVFPVQENVNMEMPAVESPVVSENAPVMPEATPVTNEAPVIDTPIETPVAETPVFPVQENVNMEMPAVESPVVSENAPVMPEATPVTNEAPVIDTPIETPVAETPVFPVQENVNMEMPAVESPVVSENAPVMPEATPVTNEAPVIDTPVETPIAETPVAPIQDSVNMEMPIPNENQSGVEIIENKEKDYSVLTELENIHEKYNQLRKHIDEEEKKEVSEFFQKRSEKITQNIPENVMPFPGTSDVGANPVQGDGMTLGLEKAA